MHLFFWTYQKLFYESFDGFTILSCQLLLIRNIELGIGIASWTNVLLYTICLTLENAHATTMEPIRAVFAANIKPANKKNVKSQTQTLQQNGLVTITLSITFRVLLLLVVKHANDDFTLPISLIFSSKIVHSSNICIMCLSQTTLDFRAQNSWENYTHCVSS